MNSVKIEKGAIDSLRTLIRLHDKIDQMLQDVDKGPSWDGDIYLYNNSDLKAEHIEYRISAQVKGRNDEKLLKRKSITYPVEYKNLRNYLNDGGVCYFVVAISDNGEKTAIFYNALTPIKLQALLNGTEKKKPDQTKNITLMRLKNNDKDELYKILLQFGHDSKEQGTGELLRKAISLEDIEKIDSMRMTTFTSDYEETMKNVKTGEVCLFGHDANADIWLPFSYELQKSMELLTCRKVKETFGVDGVPYYDEFELTRKPDGKFIIQLSENLYIDMGGKKFQFTPVTELEQVVRDIHFLEMIQQGSSFYIGTRKICNYGEVKFGTDLEKAVKNYTQIQLAVTKFGIRINKKIDDWGDADWKAMDELVKIYHGNFKLKNKTSWHMWWWQGKVIPFLLGVDKDGNVQAENGTRLDHFGITITDKHYRVPAFIMFKRDVWEKLYDVDEDILLGELEKADFNEDTQGEFSLLLMEVLAAYDMTKNEKYYDMASLLSEKLLQVSPQSDYWKINKLQILKRKRELSELEMQELENMERDTKDTKVVCAVNILLENKRKAKQVLGEMEENERDEFVRYPIYGLM